jgi:putative (di)nucleoside polyphosphate hydrolase
MKSPAQYFRAGVGAVIINDKGLVLALARSDLPNAWQMPQGGLKESESPVQALFREVREETGIPRKHLEVLDAYPEPLAYELPQKVWSSKTGRGQVGYWFLLRLRGSDQLIDLRNSAEFTAWEWLPFDILLARIVDFKKPVYQHLNERFKQHFATESSRQNR